MSETDRNAFDQLHKTNPDGGLASTWATNSFSFQHERDGQAYASLVIFNDISRANHSCLPKAIFTWNAQREVGTLYALQPIRAGAEIKIEYWPNAEQSLQTGRKRTDDLKKYYGSQCRCDSCYVAGQGNDHRNKPEDTLRSKAGRLLRQLDSYEPAHCESAAESAMNKSVLAHKHRTALEELGVKDMKLANAYAQLARMHEEAFDTATRGVHSEMCDLCDGGQDRIIYLQQARRYLTEENRIHIRCWGLVHAELADYYARQAALQVTINLATR